jgi:hypothetical protein
MASKKHKSTSSKKKNKKSSGNANSVASFMQTYAVQAMMLKLHRHFQQGWRDKNPNKRYSNATQLAKLIGRSRSGFYRLLRHLQTDHHLPIDIVPEYGGYGYTEEVVNFPGVQFSQAELIAIFAALNSLKSIRGNPFNDAAESAFQKLALALDEELTVDLAALQSVVCFRSGGFPAPVDAALIEKAVRACIDHEELIQHARPSWLEPQHLDVYIPEAGIAAEYMGQQHFEPLEFFGGERAFRSVQDRDRKKSALCATFGIELIRVRYDEGIGERAREIVAMVRSKLLPR